MAHALNLVSHDSRIAKESHYHRCPYCRRFKYESNLVCQKLGDHPFQCMTCMNAWRTQFGLDSLVDAVLPTVSQWREVAESSEEGTEELSVDEAVETARALKPRVELISPETAKRFFQEWRSNELEQIELAEAKRRNVDVLTGLPQTSPQKHPGQ